MQKYLYQPSLGEIITSGFVLTLLKTTDSISFILIRKRLLSGRVTGDVFWWSHAGFGVFFNHFQLRHPYIALRNAWYV